MNILIFILLTLIWGGSFITIKFSVMEIPPYLAASLRIMTALTFLVALRFILYTKYSFRGIRKTIPFSILVGIFNLGIPWCCLFWGERYTSPALASIINGSYPIWVLLLCLVFKIEEVTQKKIFAVILGFIGITTIFLPKIQSGLTNNLHGALAILGMAISYGIAAAILKKFSANILTLPNLIIQCISGLFVTVPASYYFEFERWHELLGASTKAIGSVLYLGIFSTAIAILLYFRLFKEIGAIRASYITFCIPFVSILLDIFVLRIPTTMYEVTGLIIILSGIIVNHYFDIRNRKKEALLLNRVAFSEVDAVGERGSLFTDEMT